MKTVILCGGKGLRYGNSKPKGLADVAGKPIIHRVIDIYIKYGYNDFLLILGHRGQDIEEYFRNSKKNTNIRYVYIKDGMQKGGALGLSKEYIGQDENFFCTYCDCLADLNLDNLLDLHINSGNIGTITAIRPYHDFGILELEDCENSDSAEYGKIIEMKEKPQMKQWANGGYFCFNRNIFDYIYSREDNLETDVFQRIVRDRKLGCYKYDGMWNTINSLKDEIALNQLYKMVKLNKIKII